MNDNIDDLITNVMESYDLSFNPLYSNNPSYQNNYQHVPNNVNMRYVNRQLDTFITLIRGYNENQLEYQRNIAQLITMLYVNNTNFRNRLSQPLPLPTSRLNQNIPRRQTRPVPLSQTRPQTRPQSRPPPPPGLGSRRPTQLFTRTTPLATTSSLFEFRTQPSLFDEPPPNPNQQPLSMDQIVNATTTFEFNDEVRSTLSDYRCPISLENFQNGDSLCRINGCGHVFNKRVLLNWLQRSSQCPVCRYNLSTNNETPPTEPREDISNNNFSLFTRSFINNPSSSMDNFESDLLTSMSQFISEAQTNLFDLSNNLLDLSLNDVYDDDSSDIEDNLSVDE